MSNESSLTGRPQQIVRLVNDLERGLDAFAASHGLDEQGRFALFRDIQTLLERRGRVRFTPRGKKPKSITDDRAIEPGALTVPAFCEWAGVGPAWTWRLIAEGKLGSVKRGKRRLIPMADAKAWLHGE